MLEICIELSFMKKTTSKGKTESTFFTQINVSM